MMRKLKSSVVVLTGGAALSIIIFSEGYRLISIAIFTIFVVLKTIFDMIESLYVSIEKILNAILEK